MPKIKHRISIYIYGVESRRRGEFEAMVKKTWVRSKSNATVMVECIDDSVPPIQKNSMPPALSGYR